MKGETVRVFLRGEAAGADPLGSALYDFIEHTVDDVLIDPMTGGDIVDSNRPDGKRIDLTLHFPKTFTESLECAEVEVRGARYRVIGAPEPYAAANTPTRWNYPVRVVRSDG
jgi:hypothetical protein